MSSPAQGLEPHVAALAGQDVGWQLSRQVLAHSFDRLEVLRVVQDGSWRLVSNDSRRVVQEAVFTVEDGIHGRENILQEGVEGDLASLPCGQEGGTECTAISHKPAKNKMASSFGT
jgi:hypothetical protein